MSITNKTIIFGGSFDPVTTAHVDLIANLARRFDKVIVTPCKLSPFKTKTGASADERLDMLNISLQNIERVEISTFELESDGVNYSYLTAEHFAKTYNKLYFAIGSEMIVELEKWKELDRLTACATLYVIPRPSFPIGEGELKKLEKLCSRFEIANFDGREGSSSEVRISIAMNEPNTFLTPEVAKYVTEKGLYSDYNYVNELYKRFNMKEKRIKHSFSTALCGVKLAKRACVATDKAITALLLHDIGKYVTKEEAEQMGVKFGSRIDGMPLPIRHAEIGAEILSQLLGIKDEEIIEAVRWHTTGRPNMTPLEKVVYLADYIEPLRDFPTVDYLRKETEKSIDAGLLASLENSVKYVSPDEIYPVTQEAYEYYLHNKENA